MKSGATAAVVLLLREWLDALVVVAENAATAEAEQAATQHEEEEEEEEEAGAGVGVGADDGMQDRNVDGKAAPAADPARGVDIWDGERKEDAASHAADSGGELAKQQVDATS